MFARGRIKVQYNKLSHLGFDAEHHIFAVFGAPCGHRFDNRFQRVADRCQRILDPRRDLGINLADNQPFFLQRSQVRRQNLLRNVAQRPFNFAKPLSAVHQSLDNLHFPAVSDQSDSHLCQVFLHIIYHQKTSQKPRFNLFVSSKKLWRFQVLTLLLYQNGFIKINTKSDKAYFILIMVLIIKVT